MVDDSMRLTLKSSTDYSIQTDEEDGSYIMARKKWLALEPWKPFFRDSQPPAGVYLKSGRRPALLPSGHEVDDDIYFAIRLVAEVEKGTLFFCLYGFRLDPGKHRERPVHHGGYRYFGDRGDARSEPGSINILRELMQLLEMTALNRSPVSEYPDEILSHVIAWDDRIAAAIKRPTQKS